MTGRRAESRLVGGIGTSREGRPATGCGRGGPGGPGRRRGGARSGHKGAAPVVFQRGSGAQEETIAADEVMARFTEKILRERPYLAPIRDRLMIPYAAEDATFIAALKGACDPDPEFAAGVAAQRIVEAAYESARTGVPVQLKS